MENTLENKEKFFAQYWDQNLGKINSYHQNVISNVCKTNISNIDYLELKPLSSITDEDVLKIAELLLWQRKILESSMISQTKEILLQESKITTLKGWEWADITDKVRELGYAYRWNGVSVEKQIEFGWIKLK